MTRLSSAAPQIGAALGAGLMILSALAFQAGARGGEGAEPPSQVPTPSESPGSSFFVSAQRGDAILVEAMPSEAVDDHSDVTVEPQAMRLPRLAIIIDDVAELQTAQAVWALPVPITVSVLPYSEDARQIALAAGDREVFLHLPMEPVGLEDPGPNALTKALVGETLAARVSWALEQVPGATGFNNHMGSRLTADEVAMAGLFSALEGQQGELIFVDSLTNPNSIALEAALDAGFVARDRDIFLDHDPERLAIDAQVEAALARARDAGSAIAIAHPRANTFAALEQLADKAEAAGVEIVPVMSLMQDERD